MNLGLVDWWWLMPLGIFAARVVDVSIGTVRAILVLRGRKLWAVGLGFFESIIWISAASFVLAHLGEWTNVLAYAGGYAAGNYVGIWLEARLALGFQAVHCVSHQADQPIATVLAAAGWQVTTYPAERNRRPAQHCVVVAPRRWAAEVIALARNADPEAMISVEEVRHVAAGMGPCPLERPVRNWSAGLVPASEPAPEVAA